MRMHESALPSQNSETPDVVLYHTLARENTKGQGNVLVPTGLLLLFTVITLKRQFHRTSPTEFSATNTEECYTSFAVQFEIQLYFF